MDIRYYVGIDIAKATLDWAVYDGTKMVLQTSTTNTIAGIKTALRLLKTLSDGNPRRLCSVWSIRASITAPADRLTYWTFSINFVFLFG